MAPESKLDIAVGDAHLIEEADRIRLASERVTDLFQNGAVEFPLMHSVYNASLRGALLTRGIGTVVALNSSSPETLKED